jgi:mono/diheme cytochrome c family protein
MRRVALKHFLYGALTALVGGPLVATLASLLVLRLGLVPINADVAPSRIEQKVFPAAVRAAVARQASNQPDIVAETDGELLAGAEIYSSLCAQCHGQLNGRPSVLGVSFYPPAPQLPGHSTSYTTKELFWIVKHGIRNTSMPAWRNLLSDQDISQLVVFLKTLDSLPPADSSTAAGSGQGKESFREIYRK